VQCIQHNQRPPSPLRPNVPFTILVLRLTVLAWTSQPAAIRILTASALPLPAAQCSAVDPHCGKHHIQLTSTRSSSKWILMNSGKSHTDPKVQFKLLFSFCVVQIISSQACTAFLCMKTISFPTSLCFQTEAGRGKEGWAVLIRRCK
jgi:hypothetical protein